MNEADLAAILADTEECDGCHDYHPRVKTVCRHCRALVAEVERLKESESTVVRLVGAAAKAEAEVERLRAVIKHRSGVCRDVECWMCSMKRCPNFDPMHFHHDGCPSCIDRKALEGKP